MERSPPVDIQFRLGPEALGHDLALRLRRCQDRWVAEAAIPGNRRHVGLGGSPRAALSAALAPLGQPAMVAVLADPGLMRPSFQLALAGARFATH